jgi:hypothetical protein
MLKKTFRVPLSEIREVITEVKYGFKERTNGVP